jgi:hypothetical protein
MPERISWRFLSSHLAGVNFGALELISPNRQKDPVAIMQMKNGLGGHHCVDLFALAGKGGGSKHAQLEEAGVGNLNTNLGRAQRWIEDGANVSDAARERAIGEGIEFDFCFLAELKPGMSFS